jgi:hypothetical protein
MAEVKDLVINEFQKGIAESPHVGFQDMHHLDVSTYPGIATPNAQPDIQNSVSGLWKWSARDSAGTVYALSDNGTLYIAANQSAISGNTKTQAHGNGLAYWHNYIFVFRDNVIDVYNPNTATWTNGWQTMASGDIEFHPAVAGQDDILYYGDGSYVGAISEKAGKTFDPADTTTYTFNSIALTLPKQYRIKCIAELGVNLMLGTIVGSSFWGGANNADIFPWDRSSDTYRLPIRINDVGVHQMITKGNKLYAVVGTQPKVYVSDGYNVEKLRAIPSSVMSFSQGGSVNLYPGAIMTSNNKILFGVSTLTTGIAAPGNVGIWGITPEGVLTYEYQLAQGLVTGENSYLVGMLALSSTSTILAGYQYSGTSWADIIGSNPTDSYISYLQSALYEVGTSFSKKKFYQAMAVLAKPLTANDGLVIKARQGLSDSFTTIGTIEYTGAGKSSFTLPFKMASVSTIQVRAELKGSIQLKEVRLR